MKNLKLFAKRHGVFLVMTLCLIAVGGIAASSLIRKNQEIENVKVDLTKANEKISAMVNDLGAAKAEAEMAKRDLEDMKAKMTDRAEDLAAFAKQAAACEAVKKKLNIKK